MNPYAGRNAPLLKAKRSECRLGAPPGFPVVGNGLGGLPKRAWTPRTLFDGGMDGVWFDPSDLGTLFQDRSTTPSIPAVLDGPVGTMLDKSGRNHHAIAPNDAARPLLKQDATGRYYLLFDGGDDRFDITPVIPFVADDGVEFFAGVDTTSLQTGQRILANRDSDAAQYSPAPYLALAFD